MDAATAATASNSALGLEVIQAPDAVARVERDWRELAARGGATTAFQDFHLASACAAAHLQRGEVPRLVIARRHGKPVVIIPLVRTSWFGANVLRFLGDPLIQYGDILAAEDAAPAEIAAAWRLATSGARASAALLRRVRDDARTADYLVRNGKETLMQETALIDLRRPTPLSARKTRELRRLGRRLTEHGPAHVEFFSGAKAADHARFALMLKRKWIDKQGLRSSVIGNAPWENAVTEACRLGTMRAAALFVGTRVAAVELFLLAGEHWCAFLGAFDDDFARCGPGQILTASCVAKAQSEGRVWYDQLPPVQPYKLQQATTRLTVRDFVLPLAAPASLIVAAARLMPEFKAIFAALPPGLRTALMPAHHD